MARVILAEWPLKRQEEPKEKKQIDKRRGKKNNRDAFASVKRRIAVKSKDSESLGL